MNKFSQHKTIYYNVQHVNDYKIIKQLPLIN